MIFMIIVVSNPLVHGLSMKNLTKKVETSNSFEESADLGEYMKGI
jgi:hypothetical protein